MKKLGQVNLPQGGGEYDRILRVMLTQYLRDLISQVNALIDLNSAGSSTVVTGLATVTVPAASTSHTETVTLTGCTSSMRVFACLAPTTAADANEVEFLNVIALAASPGTDQATVTIAFGDPTTGAVKINLLAV